MPDRFFTQEQNAEWVGVYQQPSAPQNQSDRYSKVLHNVVLRRGMPHTRPGVTRLNGAECGGTDKTMYGMEVWKGAVQSQDKLILACGEVLQSLSPSGGDPTTLTNNFPSGFPARTGGRTVFARLNDQMFIVNGVDENVKYNGTNVTKMGVSKPTTLSQPNKGAGVLIGSYQYVATLVSGTTYGSTESESTTETTVTYTNEQGTFTAPSVPSSDPQVDRWNLYRKAQGGAVFFRVNTTPVTLATSIVDNIPDITLIAGTSKPADFVNTVPPGKFKLLVSHQGRLVGVIADDPNTLYWSDQGLDTGGIFFKPENWPPVNRLPFGDQGGNRITALVSFFDWLVVFQDFGVWSIEGGIADVTARKIAPLFIAPDNRGIGCSDQTNIALAENKIIFAGKTGLKQIVRQTGGIRSDLEVQDLTYNVTQLYQQLDFDRGGVSVYDRDFNRWIFWCHGLESEVF